MLCSYDRGMRNSKKSGIMDDKFEIAPPPSVLSPRVRIVVHSDNCFVHMGKAIAKINIPHSVD